MNILVVSDFHNDVESLMKYIDKVALLDFDVITVVGDFTDYNVQRGFSAVDIGRLIIEELSSLNKPILATPGNFDKELLPFFEEEDILLHGNGKIIKNVGFYGFGGAKTPFNTPFEPSETEVENGLLKGYEEVKNCKTKVQVTHIPPRNTKLDIVFTGAHVGSEVVRKFIEKYQPNVAVCAHIHEARGTDEIGETKIINSGRFPEGYCGLVTVEKDRTETKIINLI
ncbi:MAG: metallophosphoesterase [Candidatus Aenigmarchaeota archaeon]|nr:metallophosphoesterase [Candidatus Aenigmarchaeota archaeon]